VIKRDRGRLRRRRLKPDRGEQQDGKQPEGKEAPQSRHGAHPNLVTRAALSSWLPDTAASAF